MRLLTIAVAVLFSAGAHAQEKQKPVKWNNPEGPKSDLVVHKSYQSKSMDTEVGYCVYTPPGYAKNQVRYPVIYFLHGAGGNENSDAGAFSNFVADAIADKKIPPVICVFPNGGLSGYVDRPDPKVMGETMITKELIPLIDADYQTIAKREGRVIAGFSMGGGGAIRFTLKHPDLFSAAASWAAAMRTRDGLNDPSEFAEKNADQIKDKTRLLMIVGEKDFTLAGHKPVTDKLKALDISFELKLLKGVDHDLGAYHRMTAKEFVAFLGKGLPQGK